MIHLTLAILAVIGAVALSAGLGMLLAWWEARDHEPPHRHRRRRQLRALREIPPLTRVWPEPTDPRKGWL